MEGGEALEQVAQGSCGGPIPGSAQGQVGWGFGQPGLVGGIPAHGRGWNWVIFKVLSNPNHSETHNSKGLLLLLMEKRVGSRG